MQVRGFVTFAISIGSALSWATGESDLAKALPFNDLCTSIYRAIFHNVPVDASSVTTSRKERRRTVDELHARNFLNFVRAAVGDDRLPAGTPGRVKKRDVPETPGTVYVTDTYYLPKFRGVEPDGQEKHKARIRIRQYFEVPGEMRTTDLQGKDERQLAVSRLADGEGPFVKLEFKAGKPQPDEDGNLVDTELVVEKPGITVARSDVDLLLASAESYRQHHAAVLKRVTALTLTKDGTAKPVNLEATAREMIERIGFLHEQGWDPSRMAPQTNMRYQRDAYKILFVHPTPGKPPIEVQLTFDAQVIETTVRTGVVRPLDPSLRVVELKIPEEFADLSTEELSRMGLQELAGIREGFLHLTEAAHAVPDASKPSNLRRIVQP